MKPEEIMLGDYVQVNGEVCKVISISYFDIGISDSKEDFYHEHMDNIKPIPLTPEILERNGLEQINTDYYDLDVYEANDGLWRVVYSNLECSGFDESVLVSSVHELQHFLRHLKIDKEIEI